MSLRPHLHRLYPWAYFVQVYWERPSITRLSRSRLEAEAEEEEEEEERGRLVRQWLASALGKLGTVG